ncbi:hypothetical protein [Thalassotalea piscium]|uniref:Uncharacterized protein n=1 Tax=Thalassotalea piscium TaxID=1230533 RepID=A0A7X0TT77_9GAMM|nr:hypothetical protein [Thalassotalea piscium]MBB6542864.1 hypothetical protein [Thalassotalea piscium]
MVTTKLIEVLKAKIAAVLKMSMLQRAAAAQTCVIDSVNIMQSLNDDRIHDAERIKKLEEKLDKAFLLIQNHIKTGR